MKKQYNKEITYINILIILLFVVMVTIGYISAQKKTYTIETENRTTQTELEHTLKQAINSVLYLSTSAQELIKIENKLDINRSKLVHSVNNKGEYALDIKGFSNLTGHGGLSKSKKVLYDMEMSLALFEQFKIANKFNKDFEWIYYISKYNFLTMYPYIPSSKYIWHYENALKDVWQYALQKNNPEKKLFFTPLYLDGAGKGLMVTIGKPVYQNETFRGTLNIDVTVKALSQFLNRHNLQKGTYVLVNKKNQIIASSNLDEFNTKKIFTFKGLVPHKVYEGFDTLKHHITSDYYMNVFHLKIAPWKLYYYNSKFFIYKQALIYIFFIVLIIGLLLKLKQLMRQLNNSNRKFKELASLDAMTKLYNRYSFSEISSQIFKKSKKNNLDFSLMIIDIDKFKTINDTYGHLVGDIVITHIAKLLKNTLRKDDIICRYGGEEFMVLLPETSIINSKEIAEKIRKKIESSEVNIGQDRVLFYTASFGVSCFDGDKTIVDVISKADKALYDAKRMGRNRVEIFKI